MSMRDKNRAMRKLSYHARQKGWFLVFTLTFLLGFMLGIRAYGLCSEEDLQLLESILLSSKGSTFTQLIRRQLLCELTLMSFLFISGFCAIGQVGALLLMLLRGLGLGISAIFLVQQGREGFLNYLMFYLPTAILFLFVQVIASKETVEFSMNFLRQLFDVHSSHGYVVSPRVYVIRFILLTLLSIVTVFAATLLTQFIGRLT